MVKVIGYFTEEFPWKRVVLQLESIPEISQCTQSQLTFYKPLQVTVNSNLSEHEADELEGKLIHGCIIQVAKNSHSEPQNIYVTSGMLVRLKDDCCANEEM